MSGSAWRIYWKTLGLLALAILGIMAWRIVQAPVGHSADDKASFAGGVAASASSGEARLLATGFMRAPSGRLLPRFASVRRSPARVRLGPGRGYPVAWIIRLPGAPVEVMAEMDGWWRIRDHDGEEGWIRADALQDGQRTVLVAPWRQSARLALRARPDEAARLKAWIGNGVLARVLFCNGAWCQVRAGDMQGWLRQEQLWGVYRNERIGSAHG